jgi:hypothetical protein
LTNRLLIVCFALALAINVGYTLVGLASIPTYYERVTTQAVESYVVADQTVVSNELLEREAAERGMSLSAYAVYQVVLNCVLALVPLAVATVVAWHARKQWFAWYTAFIIVFLGEYALAEQVYVARSISPEWYDVGAIFWFLLLPYLYLFPNGKPVPRRALWFVGALTLYHFVIQAVTVLVSFAPEIVADLSIDWQALGDILSWPIALNFVIIFACQVYRYVRVSTPVERQQTKWFVAGLGLMVATLIVATLPVSLSGGFIDDLVDRVLFFLLLPITIAIAILRYRLWDIDLIINRTLVYGSLTALLAFVYFGGVTLTQTIFRTLTGQEEQPQLGIVVSTLVIAALFTPLRRRIQSFIDRRFYRSKYDARKTLESFSARLRDETDLDALNAELVGVVQETMQPAHVSLWLRPDMASKKDQATG